jgi:hypothetical protein
MKDYEHQSSSLPSRHTKFETYLEQAPNEKQDLEQVSKAKEQSSLHGYWAYWSNLFHAFRVCLFTRAWHICYSV